MSTKKIESENFETTVIEIFQELSLKDIESKPEDHLNDLGIDSLGRIEVVMKLEEKYEISISDEGFVNWITVQDVIDTVERLRAESPSTVSPSEPKPKDAKLKSKSILAGEGVIEIVQEILGKQGIKLGDSLSKLKIDPWDRVEIAMALEQKLTTMINTPKKAVEKWTKEAIENWRKIEDIINEFKRRSEAILLD